MTDEIEFLTFEEILEIHAAQLERFGGSAGIRDEGAIRSAIAQPSSTFAGEHLHGDLFAMAAAYAFHLAESQAFVDGNKRTGLDAALTFLRLNGIRVPDPEGALFDAMIDLATHDLDKPGLARLLRALANV